MNKAIKRKDQAILNFVKCFNAVDPKLKRTLLKEYVVKCMQMHAVAFFQWRLMYPTSYMSTRETEGLILSWIKVFTRGINLENKPMMETQRAAFLPTYFADKYRTVEKDNKKKSVYRFLDKKKVPNKISHFAQIGWADPFNDVEEDKKLIKSLKLPNKIEDLVYDQSRYDNYGESPYVLYIPKEELMLKMMRACLRCQDEYDLWFNRG